MPELARSRLAQLATPKQPPKVPQYLVKRLRFIPTLIVSLVILYGTIRWMQAVPPQQISGTLTLSSALPVLLGCALGTFLLLSVLLLNKSLAFFFSWALTILLIARMWQIQFSLPLFVLLVPGLLPLSKNLRRLTKKPSP